MLPAAAGSAAARDTIRGACTSQVSPSAGIARRAARFDGRDAGFHNVPPATGGADGDPPSRCSRVQKEVVVNRISRIAIAMLAALPACGVGVDEASTPQSLRAEPRESPGGPPAAGCPFDAPGSRIRHVIYVQFDNVHFRRDLPGVPSDLEQMPHLLDFITDHGTLLSNHHTPLISHTANNLLTSLTGVYGDRHGQPVSNSFGVFTPPGSAAFAAFAGSFAYWTHVVSPALDPRFNMISADGKNAPAPWVAFTRAGCNVGAAAFAHIVVENVTSDIVDVFGATSPEAAEARTDRVKAAADFEGIAVHCAAGSELCSAAHGGRPDVLPDAPGRYLGFSALYGHKYVAPLISPDGPLTDLDGVTIADAAGNPGFPGFGVGAAQTLSYVAAMQEHGVPVTFAYISDPHDERTTGRALGPGDTTYVAQLAAYDRAWDAFFTRLARDGITRDNTLFVFTADENDHFVGGPPAPADCDGIHTPCSYAQIGVLGVNLTEQLARVDPSLAATPFILRNDMAPTFYIQGNPPPGAPIPRAYERATAQLTAVNPIDGGTDQLAAFLADPVEMKLLHMVTADPQRRHVRRPQLFLRRRGADRRRRDPDLRVEPRRRPARHHDHVARPGRAGRAPARRGRRHGFRSNRHPPDDPAARGPGR